MQQRGLVHPALMTSLGATDFYPDACTFQQKTVSQDATGYPAPSWANVSGLTNLACRLSPLSATERRTLEQIYATATHHLALAGNYPAITNVLQAVIDGTDYNVLGPPEHDGNGKTTRVYLERVT